MNSLFGEFSVDSISDEDIEQPGLEKKEEKEEKEKIEIVNSSEDVDDNDKDVDDEENEDGEEIETPPSGTDESSSLLTSFASTLHEKGILSEFTADAFKDAEDPYEALNELIGSEINKGVEEYKASLDPEKLKEIEAIENGIDPNEVKALESDIKFITNLKDDDYENIDLAKKIIAADLASKNFSDKEIEETLDDYESLGKLESKAKVSSKNIKSLRESQINDLNTKAEKYKTDKEQERVSKLESIKTKVSDTKEIIPGLKLNDKVKKELITSLTKPVGKDKQGNPITSVSKKQAEDPEGFEITLHYLNLLGVFDGKFDKLIKTSKSKAINEFKNTFERSNNISSSSSRSNSQVSRDTEQIIKSAKETFNF